MPTPTLFGPEFLVNTATDNSQDTSSVTALANGKFVVVWEDFSETGSDAEFNAVRGQLFNADGTKSGGEFLVNQTTAGDQGTPVVTGLTDGRFVVAWEDASATGGDTSESAIRARIFNVNGTPAGNEFLVNTTATNDQTNPAIAALTGGGFVVTWTHEFSTDDLDIRARAFNSAGTALGSDFAVDENSFNDETESAVVGLANGNYLVVWKDDGADLPAADGSGSHISAKILSGNGSVVVPEFIVNTTAVNDQGDPSIALLSNGNVIVTWETDTPNSPDGVRGRILTPAGVALGPDFAIDDDGSGAFSPSVSALANGAYAVIWEGETPIDFDLNITGQLFTGGAGTTLTEKFFANTTISGTQAQPSLTTLADGRLVAVWSDFTGSADDPANAVRAQIIDPRTTAVNLAGTSLADDFVGTAFDDTLFGGAGQDQLIGGDGDDLLVGGTGGDFLGGGNGIDTASYAASGVGVLVRLDGALSAGGDANGDFLTGVENVIGSAFDDKMFGDNADNLFDGGAGADFMAGSGGNDIYIIDNPEDEVDERNDTTGIDTIVSSISFSLADAEHARGQIENLTLTGTAANGAGNDLANTIIGNAADNFLQGGAGNDRLEGGAGNDRLEGGAGNDDLSGGAGADTMLGGDGDDDYLVDDAGDLVIEDAGGGIDSVASTISYTLTSDVENLLLDDDALGAIFGIGNALANVITGNAADNTLDGKAGADAMTGGAGNDTYIIDNAGDAVTEKANEGVDGVLSSVSFVLSADVENLTLTGSASINGTGNELANTITGNDESNIIDGGASADVMAGGAGDDTYFVDEAGDVVVEAPGSGTDRIVSTITLALGADVENLTLTGVDAINGTGNALANTITGNAAGNLIDGSFGKDILRGEAGADTIVGGKGKDVLAGGLDADLLTGGKSKDQFLFDTALDAVANVDTIADFKAGKDAVGLELDIFASLKLGDLKGKAFFEGKKAHDKSDHVIYNDKTGELFYDADGKGGAAAVKFAILDKKLDLSADDFFVV